jgi:hypothetical protein
VQKSNVSIPASPTASHRQPAKHEEPSSELETAITWLTLPFNLSSTYLPLEGSERTKPAAQESNRMGQHARLTPGVGGAKMF